MFFHKIKSYAMQKLNARVSRAIARKNGWPISRQSVARRQKIVLASLDRFQGKTFRVVYKELCRNQDLVPDDVIDTWLGNGNLPSCLKHKQIVVFLGTVRTIAPSRGHADDRIFCGIFADSLRHGVETHVSFDSEVEKGMVYARYDI